MAVYNVWKYRRARNSAAVAINKLSRRIRGNYYRNQNKRIEQLAGQMDYQAHVAVNELQGMSGGLRWLVFMLEDFARVLQTGGRFDTEQRAGLINLFGLMPDSLFNDRDVMQLELDCLSLEHGKGNLAARQAAELLDEARGGSPVEDFARQLEPHLAGMVTKEQASEYLTTTINKRRDALMALLPAAQAREDAEIAEEVALCKSDVSDTGYRREQYQAMADGGRRGALRDLHVLQDDRRKFGAVDPEDDPDNEQPHDAAQSVAPDPQTAPAAESAQAAENPDKSKPNVPQGVGQIEDCGAGTIQSDHLWALLSDAARARIKAKAAEYIRRLAEEERRE
jgi:hypothetical protein